MRRIGFYKNGNYNVNIFDDGTKIRETNGDNFSPLFPECMDVKITNQCDCNCVACHEQSTIDGKHGDILNIEFIDKLNPFTELALGGGNPLSHPNLEEFLIKCRKQKLIINMTVNQKHFIENIDYIRYLIKRKLIVGLGVSVTVVSDKLIKLLKEFPNLVVHIINGIIDEKELVKLYNNDLKLLILGYKEFGRGINNYKKNNKLIENNKKFIYDNLKNIISKFKVISFDNLAIKQLNVKRVMSQEEWNEFYMGDDGQFTMYIDLVKKQFAKSSISEIRYDLTDNIEDMFNIVKNE